MPPCRSRMRSGLELRSSAVNRDVMSLLGNSDWPHSGQHLANGPILDIINF
jgi:hypothetical protein